MPSLRAPAGGSVFNAWGPVTNGIQISIGLRDNAAVQVGRTNSIILSVRTRNVSTNVVYFTLSNKISDSPDFSLGVISPSGKQIQPRPKPLSGSGAIVVVHPNETNLFEVNLRDFCNYDEVGTYEITVASGQCILGKSKPFVVSSNPVLLECKSGKVDH
jgi:hypothetical protein